jgi:hypothetical protein
LTLPHFIGIVYSSRIAVEAAYKEEEGSVMSSKTSPAVTRKTSGATTPTATISSPTPADITPLLNLPLRLTLVAIGPIPERNIEGSLFTFDATTGMLVISALDPSPASNSTSTSKVALPVTAQNPDRTEQKRSYHFIKSNQIKSVIVLSTKPDASLVELATALAQLSFSDSEAKVEKAVKEDIKQRARIGEGVSEETQTLFDTLAKTLPVRWNGQSIIVMDEVIIEPPYGSANVKGGKGAGERIERVKKVVSSLQHSLFAIVLI